MKKIFRKFTLLLLLVPMLNSCELDPIDYSDINPSIFPQSKEDLEAMVLSCYYPLRGSWWDGINTTSERGQMFVNDACTEFWRESLALRSIAMNFLSIRKLPM